MRDPQAGTHLPGYSGLTGGFLSSHSLRNLALVLENANVSFGSGGWTSRLTLPVHLLLNKFRTSRATFLLKSGTGPEQHENHFGN